MAWCQHVRGTVVLVGGGSLVRGPDLHKRDRAQQAWTFRSSTWDLNGVLPNCKPVIVADEV